MRVPAPRAPPVGNARVRVPAPRAPDGVLGSAVSAVAWPKTRLRVQGGRDLRGQDMPGRRALGAPLPVHGDYVKSVSDDVHHHTP